MQNDSSFETHDGKAKSVVIARIARLIRRPGLDYPGWQYVCKRVREECDRTPAKKGRRLPRVPTGDEFREFYAVVDKADNVQHALMLRLLFYTGVRVSELCGVTVADVDPENCENRINGGKGGKDRYVLCGKTFATTLRTHVAAHPQNRFLFRTRRNTRYTTRLVQQVVKLYAEQAGVKATPHTFRHQCITWLTRHSGLAAAELQLVTAHSGPEALAAAGAFAPRSSSSTSARPAWTATRWPGGSGPTRRWAGSCSSRSRGWGVRTTGQAVRRRVSTTT